MVPGGKRIRRHTSAHGALLVRAEGIDALIFEWYGLPEALHAEVRQGVPWACRTEGSQEED